MIARRDLPLCGILVLRLRLKLSLWRLLARRAALRLVRQAVD